MRGEYPLCADVIVFAIGSPPLARGILFRQLPMSREYRITPACAGNTHSLTACRNSTWDHPRLRGEYCPSGALMIAGVGSPPLARGIQSDKQSSKSNGRITPACAGNTIGKQKMSSGNQDHPRLRGEYGDKGRAYGRYQGSPPLARGILACILNCLDIRGITPACAGNTKMISGICRNKKDHPRLRGEYQTLAGCHVTKLGSPPLARGIH